VLGGSEFVGRLRQEAGVRDRLQPLVSLPDLMERVGRHYGITGAEVRRKSRAPAIVEARGLACYLAIRKLGHRTLDVATLLNMTPAGVSMAAHRGEKGAERAPVDQLIEG